MYATITHCLIPQTAEMYQTMMMINFMCQLDWSLDTQRFKYCSECSYEAALRWKFMVRQLLKDLKTLFNSLFQ